MSGLDRAVWKAAQLGDAITALCREGGLDPAPVRVPPPPLSLDQTNRTTWIEGAAASLGIEAEAVLVRYSDMEKWFGSARLVAVPRGRGTDLDFLIQLKPGVLLGPDLKRYRARPAEVRRAMCEEMEEKALQPLAAVLDQTGLAPAERKLAERALLDEQLSQERRFAHTFRVPVTAPWRKLFRQGPWIRTVIKLGAAHVARLAVFLLAWRVIGDAVLTGRLEQGWLIAWALLLITLVPLQMLGNWIQARFSIALGALLKQRLLAGALRMNPERVLALGAGQLLAKTYESAAVENLSLAGGFAGLVAALELAAAATVFATAGLPVSMVILLVWVAAGALLARNYLHRARVWTQIRMDLTNGLVERMVGHRTRLAQEPPERWHAAEDQEVSHFLEASRGRDRAEAMLTAGLPGAWLVAGIGSLSGAFLGDPVQGVLAAGLGAVMLANGAFRKLAAASWQLMDAWIASEQIRELSAAAELAEPTGSPSYATRANAGSSVEGKDLVYYYPGTERRVLQECSVRLEPGARVVLEGPSGGGKSTLAAVLAGLRTPQSGLLTSGGLDRQTLGAGGWRRRVALAPQFHQNHMITGPLQFNLLMGRPEPHVKNDLDEAQAVCEELGLGPLLGRMPGGMNQMVGESGWQMSQGERSRVFLARALLQGADLVILDESFGALDPETRKMAVECTVKRAKSLLVIAHR